MASLERRASLPPFSTQALPVLRHKEKISAVTLGRASQIMPTTPKGTRTFAQSHAVGTGPLGDRLALRRGQSGDRLHVGGDRGDAFRRQPQAVAHGRIGIHRLQVEGIGRKHFFGVFPAAGRRLSRRCGPIARRRQGASSFPACRAAAKIVSYSIFIPDIGNRSESAV